MFNGEESVRIADRGGDEKTFEFVEENLSSIGRVRISDRGRMRIEPRGTFENALTQTTMYGDVRRKKNGEYEVIVSYNCTFTTLGWVLFVLGILIFLVGTLVILAPITQKTEVGRRVSRTLQDLE